VLLHCGGGSFKSQMKKADASGAAVAVVIGDDEAQSNEVSVKPMQGGDQVRVGVQSLLATVNKLIK
jgi:histidyl-tRNA synthetase